LMLLWVSLPWVPPNQTKKWPTPLRPLNVGWPAVVVTTWCSCWCWPCVNALRMTLGSPFSGYTQIPSPNWADISQEMIYKSWIPHLLSSFSMIYWWLYVTFPHHITWSFRSNNDVENGYFLGPPNSEHLPGLPARWVSWRLATWSDGT
jgi:hypothetical protein